MVNFNYVPLSYREKREIYISTLDGKVVIVNEETLEIIKSIDEFLVPIQICFNYENKKIYKDVLIYKQGYKLSELDRRFINEVKKARNAHLK